jgi:hypothetical protein
MTEDRTSEDFLARWSRRKRAAETGHETGLETGHAAEPPRSIPSDSASAAGTPEYRGPEARQQDDEPFDLASLPPLESITAETDVTVFLRKGVPPDLTRAALRRAWTSDPAIRDFIGLAENSWDFNDPNAIPGFGPLDQTPEQVRRMVAELFGEVRLAVEQTAVEMDKLADDRPPAPSHGETDSVASLPRAMQGDAGHADPPNAGSPSADGPESPVTRDDEMPAVASQQNDAPQPVSRLRRSHGGALPR